MPTLDHMLLQRTVTHVQLDCVLNREPPTQQVRPMFFHRAGAKEAEGTRFPASGDVTGAANGRGLTRVGRFHRRELQSHSSVADDAEMTWAYRSLLN